MGLQRSTFYDAPAMLADDTAIVARVSAICGEFEAYGYRRVGAELRHQGVVVNGKKLRRLMREHELQPRRRRRHRATTDSDHDSPIFPDLAKDKLVDGPNQLWAADLTYIAVTAGFVYVAVILDAWSRRVIGYAISRGAVRATPSTLGSPWRRSGLRSTAAHRRAAACTIPTAGRNMLPETTEGCSPNTACSAP